MESFFTYLDKGGLIFSFLFILSIITIAIITFKFLEIYIFQNLDFSKVINLIDNSNKQISIEEINEHHLDLAPSEKRNFFKEILVTFLNNKSVNEIEVEINSIVELEFSKRQSLLPSLEIISQVSPLIGLLGTVIGMINSFNELELGGSLVDPSILAGGIWTALLTTAMGLIVAIPALVSHYFLEKKINNYYTNIDQLLRKLMAIK